MVENSLGIVSAGMGPERMTARETTDEMEQTGTQHLLITMPYGILGFESSKDFYLIIDPLESPFMWLQMADDVEEPQSFLVISPFVVCPEYAPDLPEEETRSIGITKSEDAMVLNIVTLRGPNDATINLKGPLVINKSTLQGKQIIPVNVGDFNIDHPVLVES